MASAALATLIRSGKDSSRYPASARPKCSGPGSAVRRSLAVPRGDSTATSKRSCTLTSPVAPRRSSSSR